MTIILSVLSILKKGCQWLGSMQLTAVLFALFALLMGWATFIEREMGTPFVSTFVYDSPAFWGLILLFSHAILASTVARLPWKRNHFPFLLAHYGILVLLLGCLITSWKGQEAKMVISEGTGVYRAAVLSQWQFHLTEEGQTQQIPFKGGPINRSDYALSQWLETFKPVPSDLNVSSTASKSWMSRLTAGIIGLHHRAVWGLTQLRPQPSRMIIQNKEKGRTIEVVDYLTYADFLPVSPMTLELNRSTTSANNTPLLTELSFSPESGRASDRLPAYSAQTMGKVENDELVVTLAIAASCAESSLFDESLPTTNPVEPLLVLAKDGKKYQFPISDLMKLMQFGPPKRQQALLANQIQMVRQKLAEEENDENVITRLTDSLAQLEEQQTQAVQLHDSLQLGDTGCSIVRCQLTPTIVGDNPELFGWSAMIGIAAAGGETESVQLHSETCWRNTAGDKFGITGAIWMPIDSSMELPPGRSWHKSVKLPRLELLQLPDDSLYYRYWDRKNLPTAGMVVMSSQLDRSAVGQPVNLESATGSESLFKSFTINSYRFHDELGYRLAPIRFNKEFASEFHAKVRIKATEGDQSEMFWMRTTPIGSLSPGQEKMFIKSFTLGGKPLELSLTNPEIELGLNVKLNRFQALYEPGSSTPSSFSSLVEITPRQADLDNDRKPDSNVETILIRMNQPGVFKSPTGDSWWAYQDSFRGPFFPGGKDGNFDRVVAGKLLPGETVPREEIYQSVISLNNDPGRGLKYLGSLMIILGTAWLIYRKKKLPQLAAILLLFLMSPGIVSANEVQAGSFDESKNETTNFDWTNWRLLPVFHDGRIMPLETFARQTTREISGTLSFRLDDAILAQLEGEKVIGLPPFSEFADETIASAKQEELQQWYDELAKKMIDQQKSAAKRLKQLFPKGTRRFLPAELLFSWIVEPEIWQYVPFLADTKGDFRELFLGGGQHKNHIAPMELLESKPFQAELQKLLGRHSNDQYPSLTTAEEALKKRLSAGKMESCLSAFQALTANSAKEASTSTAWYLDSILTSQASRSSPEEPFSTLEQLQRSVLRLETFLKSETVDKSLSPLSDPDYILSQKSPATAGSKSPPTLMLLKQIERIAQIYRDYPLTMNAPLFERVHQLIQQSLTRLTKHRDHVVAEEIFSAAYRQELLRTVSILQNIADAIELATLSLTDANSYTFTLGRGQGKIVPLPAGKGYQLVALPSLSFRESATMKIIPLASSPLYNSQDRKISPWGSIQTVLFAPERLCRLAINPILAETPDKPREDAAGITPLSSTLDVLRYQAEKYPDRKELTLFYLAASAWTGQPPTLSLLSTQEMKEANINGREKLFNYSLKQFTEELQNIAGQTRDLRRNYLPESGQTQNLDIATRLFQKVDYPTAESLKAEYLYTRLNAFYWMWVFSLIALICLLLSHLCDLPVWRNKGSRLFLILGFAFLVLSSGVTFWGGALRAWISGWAPVTNMFETVVLLAFLVSIFSMTYLLLPLIGTPLATAWRRAAWRISPNDSTTENTTRRERLLLSAIRFILTGLTVWITLYLCYCEDAFNKGIVQTFLDSFAMQGILDRLAVIGTMVAIIVLVPRFLTALVATALHPGEVPRRTGELMTQIQQRKVVLTLGAAMALAVGFLAYHNSAEFNPNIRPLAAVLRSNFWLTIHVLAIIISYALGTIAWGISILMLTCYLFGPYRQETLPNGKTVWNDPILCQRLAPMVLALIQSVVLFLTIGIILGARWADFSWGRFWSWDPKEVWALVTLFIYLIVLHLRSRRKFGAFGLAIAAACGAFAIIMTWYGLSFVFGGGGRHTYAGEANNKTMILYLLLSVNTLWALLAAVRYYIRKNHAFISYRR